MNYHEMSWGWNETICLQHNTVIVQCCIFKCFSQLKFTLADSNSNDCIPSIYAKLWFWNVSILFMEVLWYFKYAYNASHSWNLFSWPLIWTINFCTHIAIKQFNLLKTPSLFLGSNIKKIPVKWNYLLKETRGSHSRISLHFFKCVWDLLGSGKGTFGRFG